MKVVVMGAGLAGVTTAWYLARDGHEVVVIDRLGHMGFAMAAGAGRITAELVSGRAAPIDLDGLRIRRH